MLVSNIILFIICMVLIFYNHKKDKQIIYLKVMLNKEVLAHTLKSIEHKIEDDK